MPELANDAVAESDAGAENDAPTNEPVSITVCHKGPLLVRGGVDLLDDEGNRIGSGRKTIALCRCGHSARKPFCDGSHKKVFGRDD